MFSNSLLPMGAVLPVSHLNRLVRDCLEAGFPLLWVGGEISNLSWAASGHLYFTLKDASAQVRCTLWRSRAQLLGWRPENGERVEALALVSFYEARGEFQLNVETLRRAGQGGLFERFLKLKEKLESEGLFSAEIKRPLPVFPRRIGIVTSLQAAALSDVLSTLKRRAPHLGITLYPAPVQGEGAGQRIAAALAAAAADGNEVLILCRGGGSIEDLWAFNEEIVVRALRASPVPVVSGVGHETDFTLADFAADVRAPTPTAAAELASPDRTALLERLEALASRLLRQSRRGLAERNQDLDRLAARLLHPAERLARRREDLQRLGKRLTAVFSRCAQSRRQTLEAARVRLAAARPRPPRQAERLEPLRLRLNYAAGRHFSQYGGKLKALAASLTQLDPSTVLARGYAIAMDENGRVVRDSATLATGDTLHLVLSRGTAKASVTQTDT